MPPFAVTASLALADLAAVGRRIVVFRSAVRLLLRGFMEDGVPAQQGRQTCVVQVVLAASQPPSLLFIVLVIVPLLRFARTLRFKKVFVFFSPTPQP